MLEMFRSALSRPDGARRDEGVALILAVMVGTFGVALTMLVVTAVIVGSQNSGRDRQRTVAVSAAEAGIDASYAKIQVATSSTLRCSDSFEAQGSDVTTVNVELKYYTADGTPIPCVDGYVPAGSVANVIRAEIISTATTEGASGVTAATRKMEALANVKAILSARLGDALFSNSSMTFDNVGRVIGADGNDANVYTNNIANCQNGTNNQIDGSLIAQGSVLLSGPCKIMGDLWTQGSITLNGENAVIQGFARSRTQIDININNLNIGKRAEAPTVRKMGATCALSYCFQTMPDVPPSKPFPVIRGDAAAQSVWAADGYSVKVINDSSYATLGVSCSAIDNAYKVDNGLNNVTNWIVSKAPTFTGKTLVVNTCANQGIVMQNSNQIKLAGDLAIMSYAGFTSQTNNGYTAYVSKDGHKHVLHMIVPYDAVSAASVGTCSNPEVRLQQNSIDNVLNTLIYGPCNIAVSNSVTMTGQIYSGSSLNLNNGLNLQFAEVPVPSGAVVVPGATVTGFTMDVVYKRETH